MKEQKQLMRLMLQHYFHQMMINVQFKSTHALLNTQTHWWKQMLEKVRSLSREANWFWIKLLALLELTPSILCVRAWAVLK